MQRRPTRVASAAAFVAMLVVPGVRPSAHHSISGQYDLSGSLTLTGVVAKVEWINPHAFVHLDVAGADGQVETWALSTVPLAMMRRAGLSKEDLIGTRGETVTIEVLPGLDPSKRLGWIVRITYPDGHFYQLSGR